MTNLIEELARIDTYYWDDLEDNLSSALDSAAVAGEHSIASALEAVLDAWKGSFKSASGDAVYELGIWVYPVDTERRIENAAERVRGRLDTLIADLVRKQVA